MPSTVSTVGPLIERAILASGDPKPASNDQPPPRKPPRRLLTGAAAPLPPRPSARNANASLDRLVGLRLDLKSGQWRFVWQSELDH